MFVFKGKWALFGVKYVKTFFLLLHERWITVGGLRSIVWEIIFWASSNFNCDKGQWHWLISMFRSLNSIPAVIKVMSQLSRPHFPAAIRDHRLVFGEMVVCSSRFATSDLRCGTENTRKRIASISSRSHESDRLHLPSSLSSSSSSSFLISRQFSLFSKQYFFTVLPKTF